MTKRNLIAAQQSVSHKLWHEAEVFRDITRAATTHLVYFEILIKVEQNIKDTLNNSVLYSIWQHVSRKTVSIDEKT